MTPRRPRPAEHPAPNAHERGRNSAGHGIGGELRGEDHWGHVQEFVDLFEGCDRSTSEEHQHLWPVQLLGCARRVPRSARP
ncbi:hypothetical protein [Kitasatospora griseola]|uniref:hypothetical protein n=1 Tax=Kitasatospora griseola TaxID=2064 RepID=UPI003816E692